jgi:hypothetical protein
MAVEKITSLIPKEARIGLGVAVAGGLLYWVYKKLNKSEKEEKIEELEKEAEKVKDPDTGKTIDCTGKLTYAKSWYNGQAEILYTAMFRPGTDEAAIYGVFNKCKSDCDVAQLIASFGFRRQEFYFKTYDLRWFIYSEMDKKEISEVNRILRTKGIKYQF